MCVVSFVVVIITSVLVVKGSMITEDPPLCALLDAATQCENFEIAKICTQLCTPAEDSPLCILLDAATQCDNPEIAKICTNLCTPVLGCSEAQLAQGFFHLPGSEQCLKAFTDERLSWPEAKAKCESEGLALTKIEDDDAVAIRKKIVDNGVSDWPTWVGGRGDDSGAMRWDRSGEVLARDNALWWPGQGSNVNSGDCLVLSTEKRWMQQQPHHPYAAWSCSEGWYPLCSVISE